MTRLLERLRKGTITQEELLILKSELEKANSSLDTALLEEINSTEVLSTEVLSEEEELNEIFFNAQRTIARKAQKRKVLGIIGFFLLTTSVVYTGHKYLQNDLLVNPNHSHFIKTIVLEDSTRVYLYPNSSLSYYAKKIDSVRFVKLNGEAKFEVKHLPNRPFKVETPNSITRVLGTRFILSSKEKKDSLTLIEGSVKLSYNFRHNKPKSVILIPGEAFSINNGVPKKKLYSQDSTIYIDHENSIIYLKGAEVNQIRGILKNWYNVNIDFEDDTEIVGKIVHKIDVKKMNFSEIIEGINLVSPYKIVKAKNNEYIIMKK